MTRRSERELEHAIEQLRTRFGLANENNGHRRPDIAVVHRDAETGDLTHGGEAIEEDELSDLTGDFVVEIEREVVPTADHDAGPDFSGGYDVKYPEGGDDR